MHDNIQRPVDEGFVGREADNGSVLPQEASVDWGYLFTPMDESWIKLHRKLIDHWVYTRPEYLSIWIYILIRANWKDTKAIVGGQIRVIERGDVLTSIQALAEGSHTSVQTVRTFLKLAREDDMIQLVPNTAATHIKVLNYNRLQEVPTASQQASNTAPTSGQQAPNNIIRSKESKKGRREEEKNTYTGSIALSSGELIAELRQNDGGAFPIHAEQVERWKELYPAVDVIAELRKMMGWLDANPTKRKTRSGMMRFATNWLSKQQDKGGNNAAGSNKRTIGDRVASVDGVSYLQRIAETTQRIGATRHVSDGYGIGPAHALGTQSQDRGGAGKDGIHHQDAD